MSMDRFQAFSDGIFAILITILVLEFSIPDYQSGHLLTALINQWPLLLSYSFSYFYVGTLWLFHHDYFSMLDHIDRNVNLLNLLMLFSITLLDYPMSLVAHTLSTYNQPDLQTALIVYDIVALFISATFWIMYEYIHHHQELKNHRLSSTFYQKIKADPMRSIIIYLIAIGVTFFSSIGGAILLGSGIIFHFFAYLRMSSLMKAE
ncbi:putative membrane protein [Lentilactobacillus kosonis]|uniref:Putative membrane protein n=2 Tax=Lentilactobacillus kosonis TaxID=2810561 RepID=A0A401FNW7_9LACO|nr:TMEM175 family protein [Lentilactobacillus kosonis]GAY74006.1 putative membrane protein [Lentilactobacillus kosonis]